MQAEKFVVLEGDTYVASPEVYGPFDSEDQAKAFAMEYFGGRFCEIKPLKMPPQLGGVCWPTRTLAEERKIHDLYQAGKL